MVADSWAAVRPDQEVSSQVEEVSLVVTAADRAGSFLVERSERPAGPGRGAAPLDRAVFRAVGSEDLFSPAEELPEALVPVRPVTR